MKAEIRQRTEQIKRGEVPEGYKQTKCGILPGWKIKRLDQIAEKITAVAGKNAYETLSISAGIGFVNQAKKFGKELSGKQYEKYTVIKRGDFSYNKGNSKIYPQGCIYRLKERDIAAVPNVFECFSISNENPDYYEQLFLSGFLNRQLSEKINHGVRDNGLLNLTKDDFYSCYVPVPPIEEQQKIAEILKQCDVVIELCQDKISGLKMLKKVFLQKMFPSSGETVPEWRFLQFTDEWEQRKAKDLCSIGTGKSNTQDQIEDGEYPFFIRSDIPIRSNKYLYDCEAVITIGDGNIGKVFHYVNGKFDLHQRCYKMADFKDILGKYFYYYFSTKFYDRAMKMTAKATVDSVRLEMISEMDIQKPKEIAEQKQIAEFFTHLDTLITLHQRMFEEQKKKKKALMQLLLTGIVRTKT